MPGLPNDIDMNDPDCRIAAPLFGLTDQQLRDLIANERVNEPQRKAARWLLDARESLASTANESAAIAPTA